VPSVQGSHPLKRLSQFAERWLKESGEAEEEAAQRQQWLKESGRIAAASQQTQLIDEETPERVPYHK
jgi:hypothetical protein